MWTDREKSPRHMVKWGKKITKQHRLQTTCLEEVYVLQAKQRCLEGASLSGKLW